VWFLKYASGQTHRQSCSSQYFASLDGTKNKTLGCRSRIHNAGGCNHVTVIKSTLVPKRLLSLSEKSRLGLLTISIHWTTFSISNFHNFSFLQPTKAYLSCYILLPRNAMLARYMLSSCVRLSVCMSVCPSICPSVTRQYCVTADKLRITRITPHDSPGTLVFCCQRSWRNSESLPTGRQMQVG